jgi:hypothetical protein
MAPLAPTIGNRAEGSGNAWASTAATPHNR